MGAMHHGRFLWFDLMTTDTGAARDFYAKVVGWTLTRWDGDGPDGDGHYEMFTSPTGPIGGSMTLPTEAREMGAPTHWLGYIGAEDVDATVAEAVALGAKIYAPTMSMAEVGRFAVLADPWGAVFGVYTPSGVTEDGGRPKTPAMGHMSWFELMTGDVDAAFDFYAKLFGWVKTDAMDMGEHGIYQMFGPAPGETIGGMMKLHGEQMPPCWGYYARVPDLDAALETVKAAGGTVLNGPMEVPGGDRVAQALDPQGGYFALHAVKG